MLQSTICHINIVPPRITGYPEKSLRGWIPSEGFQNQPCVTLEGEKDDSSSQRFSIEIVNQSVELVLRRKRRQGELKGYAYPVFHRGLVKLLHSQLAIDTVGVDRDDEVPAEFNDHLGHCSRLQVVWRDGAKEVAVDALVA